jgi:transcriptional regulator with PAS, ATPase and Fis domain
MPRSRSPLRSLAALLDQSPALVALLDHKRRLIYASVACGQWLGVEEQQLLGRTANYSSEPQRDPLDAALARLAPPPEAFAGKSSEAVLPAVGQIRSLRARFLPLPLDDNMFAVLVVARDDISEASGGLPTDWHAALARLRAQQPTTLQTERLAGEHPLMRRLRDQVQLASRSQARVVVVGPRGSGTLEIATLVHSLGGGRAEALAPLRGSLQDAETLQAAIRALSRQRGKQPGERAPAILLTDVHLLPDAAQQELLGFLQLPGFELRIIATSRAPLAALAKKGKFSPELATLLATLELRVPPLKERAEDVPLLAQLFVERFNAQGGSQFRGLVPEAIEQLVAYDWPENIDELATMIADTCERAAGPWIVASDLPERLGANWQELARPRPINETIDLDAFLAEVEKELMTRALARAKGNKSEAARLLGVSRPRLLRRLVQLKLVARDDAIDFRPLDEPSQEAS